MDPYKTLGVSEGADKQTIKKAYRKLAAQHHPDRGGDAEKFKEVAEAYSILSDNKKKQEYHARKQGFGHGFNIEDIFGNGFGPFEDFFRPQTPRQRQVNKNTQDSDIQFSLKINLEQIKRGASQQINFKRNKICADCNGAGGEGKTVCNVCGGTGTQVHKPAPFFIQQVPCQACRAQGVLFQKPCVPCGARGHVEVHDKVIIKIEEEK
jgi:molecular chaperone DnaJ